MTDQRTLAPVIRRAGEGEKRWFFGGGVFTWKLSSVDEDITLIVVDMVEGKWTPTHTHPVSESMWVLDGQIRYRVNDDEHELEAGHFVMVPAGVPHAFIVKSPAAKVLGMQPTCECEPFYRGASEPLEGSACVVDFARLAQSTKQHGGIDIVGPHRSETPARAADSVRCSHTELPRSAILVMCLNRSVVLPEPSSTADQERQSRLDHARQQLGGCRRQ